MDEMMETNISRVMLVEATGKVGASVRRSLERRGLTVMVSELKADDPKFAELLRGSGAGMVMPVFHPESLARNLHRIPAGVSVPIDSYDKLMLLDNKLSASALAASLGIRQPRIYDDVSQISSFPVVFKRSEGLGGAGVYFPKDATALEHLLATAGRKGALVMDYIQGNDYSVDALRGDGFFYAAAYRTILPRRKGTSYLRKSVEAPELVETARKMLEAIDFHGVCGFDFRVDAEGNAYFLECNPRFSGGLRTQLQCGFDQPYLWWRLAAGLPCDPSEIRFKAGKYSVDPQK